MYIPFEEMPNHARVWVYQIDRQLTDDEAKNISITLEQFINNWQAHGTDLKASFQLPYNRFIIIAADQEHYTPTGCSIDASVAVIRQIEQQYGLNLFDRMAVAFKRKDEIETFRMNQLKELAHAGDLEAEHITFNNLVENVGQLHSAWEVPAKETWLSRYFAN
ncbi:MAG: hypothetical protein ACPGJS_22920 [Flammeovirgaceae bacterium]